MSEIIDAKGLLCPKPVMLAKKALDSGKEFTIVVDNQTAAENVKMFAKSKGCSVDIVTEGDSIFHVHVFDDREGGKDRSVQPQCDDMSELFETGPTVFVF